MTEYNCCYPDEGSEEMSSLLRVKLEGLPPSVNQMYRTGKYGTRYKKLEVEEWQGEVSNAIRQEWGKVRPYTEEVEVRIIFTVKGNRRWDIDNRLKALLDCFGGSGTTLIACEMTGRICLMMEISPEYCEIIRERYEKMTEGKLPLEG